MPSKSLYQSTDPKLPTSRPFENLKDLVNWSSIIDDGWNIPTVALRERPLKNRPEHKGKEKCRIIVCHDMAGGYKEDFAVQGNLFESIYSCQYWQYIDTFIYIASISLSFSHKRVTIPPCNWTNAAHRNGVKILGTFIVEWDAGVPELDLFLAGPGYEGDQRGGPTWSTYFADKLVDLAEHYRFDGYLINIESSFSGPKSEKIAKARYLVDFCQYLTRALHARIPGAQLIWYDSLTYEGIVRWQNELNILNLAFFTACDGIFLNYTWSEDQPFKSAEIARAIGRERDVYVGNDVHGRGTYGGGKFDTWKGLEVIQLSQTSAAIFAPAWVYESLDSKQFQIYDRLFWLGGRYSEYPTQFISVTGPEVRRSGIADYVVVRTVPGQQWFASWFDRGFGKKFWIGGKLVHDSPWSHLSHQSIPPNIILPLTSALPPGILPRLSCDFTDKVAYLGGTSLVIHTHRQEPYSDGPDYDLIPLYDLSAEIGCNGVVIEMIHKYADRSNSSVHVGIYVRIGPGRSNANGCDENEMILFLDAQASITDHDETGFSWLMLDVEENEEPVALKAYEVITAVPLKNGTDEGWERIRLEIAGSESESKFVINEMGVVVYLLSTSQYTTESGVQSKPHRPLPTDLTYIGQMSIAPRRSPSNRDNENGSMTLKLTESQIDLFHNDVNQAMARLWGSISWDSDTISTPTDETNTPEFSALYYRVLPDSKNIFAALLQQKDSHDTEFTFLGTAFGYRYRISGLDVHMSLPDADIQSVITLEVVVETIGVMGEMIKRQSGMLEWKVGTTTMNTTML